MLNNVERMMAVTNSGDEHQTQACTFVQVKVGTALFPGWDANDLNRTFGMKRQRLRNGAE